MAVKRKTVKAKPPKAAARVGKIAWKEGLGSAPFNAAADDIIQEINLQKAELKAQNENLLKTRNELEASRQGYIDLYDHAPCGYVTCDKKGIILEANLTAAWLLGAKREKLVGKPIYGYACTDRDNLYRFIQKIFSSGKNQALEAEMVGGDHKRFSARLEGALVRNSREARQCRLIIIDNSELKEAENMLKQFPQKLMEFQEAERKRIAAALHDSLAQNMVVIHTGIRLSVKNLPPEHSALAQLHQASELALRTKSEIMEISYGLRPPQLDQMGLKKALESLAKHIAEMCGINIDIGIRLGPKKLPPNVEINIYRIVQEGLTNIVKHSGAKNSFIDLSAEGEAISISITDDGHGFNPKKPTTQFGLIGIRERAQILGGSFAIDSGKNEGTTITVILPLGGGA